jgi:hypothetical protein
VTISNHQDNGRDMARMIRSQHETPRLPFKGKTRIEVIKDHVQRVATISYIMVRVSRVASLISRSIFLYCSEKDISQGIKWYIVESLYLEPKAYI